MKRFLKFVLLLLLTSSLNECKNWIFEARKDAYLENAEKLSRYRGILRETQKDSSALYELFWNRPDQFHSKILEPKEFKGSVVNWNGDTLRLYFPKTRFGIEFLHLKNPDQEEAKTVFSETYDWNLKNFEPELGDGEIISGKHCVPISYRPIVSGKFFQDWEMCIHNDFSFPMRVSIFEKDSVLLFRREFVSIKFNEPISTDQFAFDFPPRTEVVVWDLNSKNYKLSELKPHPKFPILLPMVPEGFELQKVLKPSARIPGFLFLYKKGPYFIGLTQTFEIDAKTLDLPSGMIFPGTRSMELHFLGLFSSFSFVQKKVRFFLFGNLPYQELGEIADSIPKN